MKYVRNALLDRCLLDNETYNTDYVQALNKKIPNFTVPNAFAKAEAAKKPKCYYSNVWIRF